MRVIDYLDAVPRDLIVKNLEGTGLTDNIATQKDMDDFKSLILRTYNYIKLLARTAEPVETDKKIIVLLLSIDDELLETMIYIFMDERPVDEVLDYCMETEYDQVLAELKSSAASMNSTPFEEWLYCEVQNASLNTDGTESVYHITEDGILALILVEMVHSLNGITI